MSVLNNESTLNRCLREIWLSKPSDFSGEERYQNINVCIRRDSGEFVAVDFLTLEPDGNYYKNGKRLGPLDSPKLTNYLESILSVNLDYVVDAGEEALFEQAAELYRSGAGIKAIAKETGLSSQKIRRILVTKGLLESDVSRRVQELHSAGRTIPEIQQELGVSATMVRSYLPYKLIKGKAD